MDDDILLEDASGKINQKKGTGKSESLLKDAIDDVNKEKDTYSNRQAALHPKDFNDEHLETVNDETHLETLGQNVTDTVNQSENKVFFYSINDESEENKNQQQRTGDICDAKNIKADKSPGDSNVLDPTISTLEDSKMMQRPPSHITVANWAKEKPSTKKAKPFVLDSITEKAIDISKLNDSKKKQTNDSAIADITEKSSLSNINIEATSESKPVENEKNNIDGIKGVPDDKTDSKALHDESEDGSCMDCIKPVQVNTWKEVKQGDHIILSRSFYDHHAIVIRIIPPENDNSLQISLELIHQTVNQRGIRNSVRRRRPIVKLERKTETVDLKTIMICKYWGEIKPKSPEEIVKRASDALGGDQEEFGYNVFNNNCEHFASWCVTGRSLSIQIRKAGIVLKIFCRKGFRGLSDERLRNQVEYEHGMLCKTCFERNDKLLSVTRKKVREKDGIQKGDIILYRYYKLLHCSVVLDVIKRKEKYIKCEIAHYAFKGPFTKNIIQSGILKVPYNGSVSVFDYTSGEFLTYEPEEVVCRAKKRIGEQLFAYFSNDSSHFARWCKLKLSNSDKYKLG
ncbi:uncharacterized protein LOC134719735 [Mytilus trossulus]|uniref:uncharacterized protein LOC134719735 n=1 Tax=Mytilus trossulus TaxID=6551 RepID=UPI0030044078